MGPQVSVQQVLSSIGTALKAYEVRTLAVEVDGRLHNLATVIEFARWPVEILKKNKETDLIDDRIQKGCLVPLQSFHSTADWNQTVEDFKRGTVQFGLGEVALVGDLDLNSLKSRIGQGGTFVQSEMTYPLFEVMCVPGSHRQRDAAGVITRFLTGIPHGEPTEMQMSRSGYHSYREFLHARFGARRETEPQIGAVYVAIPIPATIHQCRYDPAEAQITARAIIAPELQNSLWVRGRISFTDPEVTYEIRFADFKPIPNEDSADCVYTTGEWDIIKRCKSLDVRLVHHELGIVQWDTFPPSSLLELPYSNPVLAVMRRFCAAEKFQEMLTNSESDRNGTPKPQRAYEKYVQWLLSMSGFISINLGAYEHLQEDANSKVRSGSLDILAFHPERRLLLLTSCTMKAPDEGDYSNLLNLRASLAKELGLQAGVETRLVIFTRASAVATDPRYGTGGNYIAVLDAPTVQQIANELEDPEPPTLFAALNPAPFPILELSGNFPHFRRRHP